MAQYRQDETDISLSMLLEVVDALKGYGADVVIVGGWAPYLLLQKFGSKSDEQHVGSLDGDLALNFKRIPEEKYETIVETLTRIGYAQRTNATGKPIPASFQKTIKIGDVPFAMQIDFLAGDVQHSDVEGIGDGQQRHCLLYGVSACHALSTSANAGCIGMVDFETLMARYQRGFLRNDSIRPGRLSVGVRARAA